MGYTGGTTADPTYKSVCAGEGGHTEAMRLAYDPSITSYEALLTYFLEDPRVRTVWRKEEPQYKTAVWAQGATQAEIARRLSEESGKNVPVYDDGSTWHDAEDWHQHFFTEFKEIPEELYDDDDDDVSSG